MNIKYILSFFVNAFTYNITSGQSHYKFIVYSFFYDHLSASVSVFFWTWTNLVPSLVVFNDLHVKSYNVSSSNSISSVAFISVFLSLLNDLSVQLFPFSLYFDKPTRKNFFNIFFVINSQKYTCWRTKSILRILAITGSFKYSKRYMYFDCVTGDQKYS